MSDRVLKWSCVAMLAISCWLMFILICASAGAAAVLPSLTAEQQAYVAAACSSADQNAIAPTGSSPEALYKICPSVGA